MRSSPFARRFAVSPSLLRHQRTAVAAACLVALAGACSSDPKEEAPAAQPQGTAGAGGGASTSSGDGGAGGGACVPGEPRVVDKADILFAIDNSRSMADKQRVLDAAVPNLLRRLVNPLCRDETGAPTSDQPAGPLDECPSGKREASPITDIHVGVVSSSLGGHGADACPDLIQTACDPSPNTTNNDHGHLLSRLDAYGAASVPTYEDKGFLAWDPEAKLDPPGEADLDALTEGLRAMTLGVGQIGCGYESQLEGWYRFLVDPEPYASISVVAGKATQVGVDTALLAQRADFLRPDSLLLVVVLSDENDCSIKEYGQYYFAAQIYGASGTVLRMPRARSICATDPNDACCAPCIQDPKDASGNPCPADAACDSPFLTEPEDPINLRCFDQKRRFGIDFLYPIDRYTTALSEPQVPNRAGDLVPNPVFSDLDPSDALDAVRDPGLVLFAAIVGVPWQDIARPGADGQPDLLAGFKSAAELAAKDASGVSTWDIVLGDPASHTPPLDPLMRESVEKRTGENPVTGDALVDGSVSSAVNPINGNERTIPQGDDLQYACIFDLIPGTERDCSVACQSCDCLDPSDIGHENPLCETDPTTSSPTLQVRAKAYPGLRELAVAKGAGEQAVVASACPAHLDPARDEPEDYGYRPAVRAIVERMNAARAAAADPGCE